MEVVAAGGVKSRPQESELGCSLSGSLDSHSFNFWKESKLPRK